MALPRKEHLTKLAVKRAAHRRLEAKKLSDLLNEINMSINSSLDFDEIMECVVVKAAQAIDCPVAIILLREDNHLVTKYVYGQPKEWLGKVFSFEEARASITSAEARKPVAVTDAFNDDRANKELMKEYNIRSLLALPLMIREEFIGSLVFHYFKKTSFSNNQIDFANKLAASLSLAIENARLYREEREAKNLSQALNKINADIHSTRNFSRILQKVTDEAARVMEASIAGVLTKKNKEWMADHLYGLPKRLKGASLLDKDIPFLSSIAKSKRLAIINDPFAQTQVNQEIIKQYNIRSGLIIPLITKGKVIGLLGFVYRYKSMKFCDAQIDFVKKLGAALTLAIQNSQFYKAQRNIADTLQEALLHAPKIMPGIEFGYLYDSATEIARVGGDFYDLFELEHNKIGIIIGDVSGKGLEAATLTSLVKNTIKAYAYQEDIPSLIMEKTSQIVKKQSSASTFVTVFFGILDTASGQLIYCNAGHPQPILKRKEKIYLLKASSSAIGVMTNERFIADKEILNKEDLLVLYTDGVTEARCNGGFYGEEHLVEFIKRLKPQPAKEMPQIIFEDVKKCSGGKLSDDVVLLAIALEK